jgi:hypothetical protein
MSKKNTLTLRVKFACKEVPSTAVRRRVELALGKFIAQLRDYCASRGAAFPDGIELNFPDGSHYNFSGPKSKKLTEGQKEILTAIGTRHRLEMYELLADSDSERIGPILKEVFESIGNTDAARERIAKTKATYFKLRLGKLSRSEKERGAFEFFAEWQEAERYDAESIRALSLVGPMRIAYLTQVFHALSSRDAEFFAALTRAIQRAERFKKHDRARIKRRLIETDELVRPADPISHWKEILEKHVPDWKDTPQNFQHLLDECGIPFERGEFRRKRVEKREKNTR